MLYSYAALLRVQVVQEFARRSAILRSSVKRDSVKAFESKSTDIISDLTDDFYR